MIRCGFEQSAALMGCTSVQNIFILEYMPKAPELYCKVYPVSYTHLTLPTT